MTAQTPDDYQMTKLAAFFRAIEILQGEVDNLRAPDDENPLTWRECEDSEFYDTVKRLIKITDNPEK